MCFVSFPCKAAKQLKLNYLTWFYRTGAWRKGTDVPLRLWLQKPYVDWFCICSSKPLLSKSSSAKLSKLCIFSLENLWHKGEPMTLGKPAYCHLPFLWPLGGAVALHWGPDAPIDLCRKTKCLDSKTFYLLSRGNNTVPYLRKEENDQLQNTAS